MNTSPLSPQKRRILRRKLPAIDASAVAGAGSGGESDPATLQLTASWEEPANKLYYISPRLDRSYTISRVSAQLSGGTCTIQLFKVGSSISGTIDVTTALGTTVVDIDLAAGDALRVQVTSVSGAENLCIALDYV
jgi:hypothetical protein